MYSGLTAMELWANTYSDRKQSVKTQRMLAEAEIVEKTREYVAGVACKVARRKRKASYKDEVSLPEKGVSAA